MATSIVTNFTENGIDLGSKYVNNSYLASIANSVSPLNTQLYGWGYNFEGQLGLKDTTYRSSPVLLSTSQWSKVRSIGTNPSTIGLKKDGTLWAWGLNQNGDLGDNTTISRSSPVQIGVGFTWTDISAKHAIRSDGTLWGWGKNNIYGELGLGDKINRSSPTQVGSLNNWKKVYSGDDNSYAIKTDGTLWGWGYNGNGQLGLSNTINVSSPVQITNLTGWTDVSIGASPLFIRDGKLFFTGIGTYMPVYTQNTGGRMYSLSQVGSLTDWSTDPSKFSIHTGSSYYINTTGTMYSSGKTMQSTTYLITSSPVQVGNTGEWLSVSASDHTLAIKTNGTLWAWGSNSSGQLGLANVLSTSSPAQVGSETNWSKVLASRLSSYAIKTDGTLWVWGLNSEGELGLGNTSSQSSPVQVGTMTNWASFSTSTGRGYPAAAIKTDGTLWTWGQGAAGSLGDNTVGSRSSPAQVGSLTDWQSLSVGDSHVLAVKTDGSLWSWGYNASGQLGIGNTVNISSPIRVGALNNWKQVCASNWSSYAVKTDGTLWVWGFNFYGALLIPGSRIRTMLSPTQVGIDSDWASLSVGQHTSADSFNVLAVKTDGRIYSAGSNVYGVLGYLTNGIIVSSSPTQIGTDSNWMSLNTATNSTNKYAAIKTDGTLWTWGSGNFGAHGHSTDFEISSPTQLGQLTGWASVSLEHESFLGINNNKLYSCGHNGEGKLGLGLSTVVTHSSPIQVGTLSNWISVNHSKGGSAFGIMLDRVV